MPNVFPDDILRRLRALEKKVGIGQNVAVPFFGGTAADAQILIFQAPPAEYPPPGAWAAVAMSGDATINDTGVVTVTGGSSGFPISYDDGTNTYEITASGGDLLATTSNDVDPTIESHISIREDFIRIQAENGGSVSIESNASGSVSLIAKDGGGVYIEEQGGGSPAGVYIYETGGVGIFISSDGGVFIDDTSAAGIQIGSIPATKVGFHGATAVVQAAHPVTLGDVITLLTNLGLCA